MNSKKYLFTVLLFPLLSARGQERLFLQQTTVSKALNFEKEINPNPKILSQNVSLSKDYFPLFEKYPTGNPLIVQRTPIEYLPVYAEYFYTPNDSIVRLVSYDWEKDKYGNFFDKMKIWKEESKKFDDYNKEYERVRSIVISILGNPSITDSTAKTESSGGEKYFTRESLWETEDFYANLSMIFHSNTYRVRLTLYWKK